MRPFKEIYGIGTKFLEPYPENLKHLTRDGLHHGWDFLTPQGVSVTSVVNGVIAEKGWMPCWGLTIWVKFKAGGIFNNKETYRAIWAHLSGLITPKGVNQKIKKGELLGLTGNTGSSTGPHCHFEVQKLIKGAWVPFDPGVFFA